jgi:hypothetical protein
MRRLASFFCCAVIAVSLSAARVQADYVVATGWDLFETLPTTNFLTPYGPVFFKGEPLGSYDFGGTIGVLPTGTTDTIVQRLDPAIRLGSTPGPAPIIDIELVALHLRSVAPVDIGGGIFHDLYVTLQKERGGPASPGNMTITFAPPEPGPGGTFDSFFDVFFDIRLDSLSGPIQFSGNLPLNSNGTPWQRDGPHTAIMHENVNVNLAPGSGIDHSQDFWPINVTELHPGVAIHQVVPASVPEASTVLVWSILASLAAVAAWWQRRAKA